MPGVAESDIRDWRYGQAVKDLLVELHRGSQVSGSQAVCAQLLAYVQHRHPLMIWSPWIGRLGFAGLTIALPVGYAVLLHPQYISPSLDGAAIIAHELGHVLWNSHGFDSSEEEYFCDRVAGRAYQEMLSAAGSPAADAERLARGRFPALGQSLSEWTRVRRQKVRHHPLRPWTWFDSARAADVASNLLLGLWINLGVWGYPAWASRRDLGK